MQNKKTRYGRNAEVDFTNNVFFCLRQYDVRTNKLKPYHRWLLNIEPPADSMPSTQEEEAASDDSSDVEFKVGDLLMG